MINWILGLACLALAGTQPSQQESAARCDHLPDLIPSNIHNVNSVKTSFVEAHRVNESGVLNSVPFCRLSGSIPYTGNNSVLFEVWLPERESYNGRYLSVGNGGFAGIIDSAALVENLNKGFAVAGGDGGHRARENHYGAEAPDLYFPFFHDTNQVLAWLRNSIAYFTLPSQKITSLFYGQHPKYSYYKGCSTGGGQGFALAQFHPHIFDGIIASCPGNWYSHLMLSFLWNHQAVLNNSIIPQETLEYINSKVIDVCDGLDGIHDGVLENPLDCKFDISTLACGSSQNSTECLTNDQIEAYHFIRNGPHDARTNQPIYPGFVHGSEASWSLQQGELSESYGQPLLKNMLFENLSFDPMMFNWDSDVALVDKKISPLIDSMGTNLTAFKSRGGKLLASQGWADPYNGQTLQITHLDQVAKDTGAMKREDWLALYMIPGGGHCGANENYPQVPYEPEVLESMIKWVEEGITPQGIRSSKTLDGSKRTRKVCPWPQTARYIGGDNDDWESFVCSS